MNRYAKWLVLWSLWAARVARQPSPVRRLPGGALLRGQLASSGTHHQYFGIPYATARRFQDPAPTPPWDGVLEAVDENIKCPQLYGEWLVVGREECLTLNVYSPLRAAADAPDGPLPVMVFIHGGGYKEGSGSRLLYGPDYLVSRGVVLVTINYRLNVLGFMCLGIKQAPGNAGLKDQVAALKWVQRNIRAFNGDPDNVTIFGESAGASSVSYHLLSPMSKGLFHKAILQSGSSLAPWSRQRDPIRAASILAKSLGYDTRDPYELYDIFKNKTLSDLIVTKFPKNEKQLVFTHPPFTPCTERAIDGVEPFLTDLPYNILSGGEYNRVPVIIGFTDEEGYFLASLEDNTALSKISIEESMPVDLNFPSITERREAADYVRKLYMEDRDLSRGTVLRLSQFLGDSSFKFPTIIETEMLLATNDRPVYSYIFQYDGWRNFHKLTLGPPYWTAAGAAHADDLFYLFSLFPMPSMFETKMINRMTTMWTNFAKFGDPTPAAPASSPELERWPAASASPAAPATLALGSASAAPRVQPLGEHRPHAMDFWRTLYYKYRTR